MTIKDLMPLFLDNDFILINAWNGKDEVPMTWFCSSEEFTPPIDLSMEVSKFYADGNNIVLLVKKEFEI